MQDYFTLFFSELQKTAQPTPAQAEAGNYKMKHINYNGMEISIENPSGSVRSGTSGDGKEWRTKMHHHYGYIKGTKGRDKDHVDVFINPGTKETEKCFIVNQVNPKKNREFDEHKCMLGFSTKDEAERAYLSNYEKGWDGIGSIVEMSIEDFKKWVYDGKKTHEAKEPTIEKKSSDFYFHFFNEMTKMAKSIYDPDVREDLKIVAKKGKFLPMIGSAAGVAGGIYSGVKMRKLPLKYGIPLGILATFAGGTGGAALGTLARRARRDVKVLTMPEGSEFKKRYMEYRRGNESNLKELKSFGKAMADFKFKGKPITNPKHQEMVKLLYSEQVLD